MLCVLKQGGAVDFSTFMYSTIKMSSHEEESNINSVPEATMSHLYIIE